MKLAILGPLERGYEQIRLLKEAKTAFNTVSYFPIPHVVIEMTGEECSVKYKDKELSDYDCILPRIPRTYRTFGFTILSLLKEKKVFCPIQPMSLFLSHNKFLTLLVLRENDLPIPDTFLALKRNVTEGVLDDIGYPVVLKLLYGSRGRGVMFADSKQSAISFIDTLEIFKEPIFVEEYLPNPGEDIRVYVVGYEVVASMKRRVRKDERRANIGIGGTGIKYKISKEYADISIKAAKALGMEICGIDIIETPKGPFIVETNVSAQFQGLEHTSGVNVARTIIDYMKERASE